MTKARPREAVEFTGVQERFAGNTADIEASSTEPGPFFHTGYFHTELRRPNGRHISARSRPDYDEIKLVRHRQHLLLHLEQEPLGILDALLDSYQEADGLTAVDEAVIIGQ